MPSERNAEWQNGRLSQEKREALRLRKKEQRREGMKRRSRLTGEEGLGRKSEYEMHFLTSLSINSPDGFSSMLLMGRRFPHGS